MGAGGLLPCCERLGEPSSAPSSAPSSTQSSQYNPRHRAVLAPSGQRAISGQDWDLGGEKNAFLLGFFPNVAPRAGSHKRCGACSTGSHPGKAPIKREGQAAQRSYGFPAFKRHFFGPEVLPVSALSTARQQGTHGREVATDPSCECTPTSPTTMLWDAPVPPHAN